MDRDFDYNLKIAEYIFEIFKSDLPVVWSWGIDPASIQVIDLGVKFHVQGFKHKGMVQVVINEGEDLFEVSLISETGEIVKTIEHIFLDNLISVIDDAVEKCDNYEERICEEYGIVTGKRHERLFLTGSVFISWVYSKKSVTANWMRPFNIFF